MYLILFKDSWCMDSEIMHIEKHLGSFLYINRTICKIPAFLWNIVLIETDCIE